MKTLHSSEKCNRSLPNCSVIIVNHNGLPHLKKCLPSIFRQHYPDYDVIVVDNASTDGSIEFLVREFPQLIVVRNKENLGYTGANNVGFKQATGKYVAVLNPDTEVEPNWLEELVIALEEDQFAAMATPKILLMDNPEKINACGNDITFTGLTFCRGLDQQAESYLEPEFVSAVSGAAFVIRRCILDQIGGFDENLFMYYEDTDLSLRAMLAGYKCLFVPKSIIYHQYAFRFPPEKCFYQERNRYYSLFKTLRWQTFIVLLPELLISEILAWGYASIFGTDHIKSKYRSWVWLIKNRNQILMARQNTQSLRQVDDKTLLNHFTFHLNFTQTTNPLLGRTLELIVNPLLFVLGNFSKVLTVW
jgi:GT2 family glycosyltransferase